VRTFHWLLALCFAGSYISAESESWRLLHVTLGYTMGGLIAFRLVWGVLGTRYARFGSFVRAPSAVRGYVKGLVARRPAHYIGHNPAGAVAIVLMLLVGAAIVASGYAVYNELGGDWLEEVHEVVGNTMLLLVGVHIVGVAVASYLHRENLPRSMVTGVKQGKVSEGIARAWWSVALGLLLAVAAFWYLQWRSAPQLLDVAQTSHALFHGQRGPGQSPLLWPSPVFQLA
jgi:cytochrome b